MSFFDLPMSAGPNDPVVGIDELGRPVRQSALGAQYGAAFAEPQQGLLAPMQGPRQDMARGDRRRRRDEPGNPPDFGGMARGLLDAAVQGFTAPGRAAQGQPVTMGDAFATALDFGLLGAPMAAPQGALRAGGMRKADEGFTAYHGSPHSFDRFQMDKIGTGEGAQAYGHGLYFAESEDVARSYRNALAPGEDARQGVMFRGAEMPDAHPTTPLEQLVRYMRQEGYTPEDAFVRARNTFPPDLMREIDGLTPEDFSVFEQAKYKGPGSMYEVRINANPDDFLDWDAPFQSADDVERFAARFDGVDPAMRRRIEDYGYMRQQAGQPMPDGNDIIREVFGGVGEKASQRATETMREAGIPGIRYRDAGSRGLDGAQGTRNFVVFDENLIEIVRKYGIAGAAAMLGVSAADVEGAMAQGQPKGLLE